MSARYLSVAQIAEELGIPLSTAYERVKSMLVRSATDEQHEAHVKLWADRVDQRDRRTRHVERLYPEAWAKAGAK